MPTRLLFVDDELSIRQTLPLILKQDGFDVSVAATVAEGLGFIQQQKFDALLTDLNIGNPADGLVLVSAMRRLQPDAATFILTGYPDLDTAIEAIRQQVDDYFTKPADPRRLLASIRERLLNPRRLKNIPKKTIAELLEEKSDRIVELWLEKVLTGEKLRAIPIGSKQRTDHLPPLIDTLTTSLRTKPHELTDDAMAQAVKYGAERAAQGYSAALLANEVRLLTKVIGDIVEEHLLEIELSSLVRCLLSIGENLNALLEIALDSFDSQKSSAQPKAVGFHRPS